MRADIVVERLVCFYDHGYCLRRVVVGAHAAWVAEWVGLGEVLEGEGGGKGVGGWFDVEVYGADGDGRGDNDAFPPGHTSLVAFFDRGIAEAVEDMVPEPQAKACHCVLKMPNYAERVVLQMAKQLLSFRLFTKYLIKRQLCK